MRVIHVARKPLDGTVATNALRWGTGGLNVDAGRIGSDEAGSGRWPANIIFVHDPRCHLTGTETIQGFTLDIEGEVLPLVKEKAEVWKCVVGCPVRAIDEQGGERTSGKVITRRGATKGYRGVVYGTESRGVEPVEYYGDSGVVSRYFKQVQDEPEFFRAAGDCICRACGEPYRKHPYDMKTLAWHGEPWLHVLCDGRRVKL